MTIKMGFTGVLINRRQRVKQVTIKKKSVIRGQLAPAQYSHCSDTPGLLPHTHWTQSRSALGRPRRPIKRNVLTSPLGNFHHRCLHLRSRKTHQVHFLWVSREAVALNTCLIIFSPPLTLGANYETSIIVFRTRQNVGLRGRDRRFSAAAN